MPIINTYTTAPRDVKVGDVMVCKVTLHVIGKGVHGGFRYRMYRCSANAIEVDEVPQGSRIYEDLEGLQRRLFPLAGRANAEPDVF